MNGQANVKYGSILAVGLLVTVPNVESIAVGDDARAIRDRQGRKNEGETTSYVLSGVARMREAMNSLPTRYCRENWNGYNEKALSTPSWEFAYRFLDALPPSTKEADVLIDADGEVNLEWYYSKDCYLSLLFAESGALHCFFKISGCKFSAIYTDVNLAPVLNYVNQICNV